MNPMNQVTETQTADVSSKRLYRLAGAASISMVAIILAQLAVFIIAPPPLEGTVMDWFALFQKNPMIGLLDFELLMVVYVILSIPLTLALYTALRRTDEALTLLYLILGLVGTISFIAARPAFEMLSLSNQYTVAATDAQRAACLAAGEAMIAIFHGTAFQVSYILGSITGLMVSVIMLKGRVFGRATAYIRILSSIFDFGIFIPTIGIFISIFSVLFLLIWNILVARRFFQLGQASNVMGAENA